MISNNLEISGRVIAVRGPAVIASLPYVRQASICEIYVDSSAPLLARVVGFEEERVVLAPFDVVSGIAAGQVVRVCNQGLPLCEVALSGNTVVNCFGRPIDVDPSFIGNASGWDIRRDPPIPLKRTAISEQFLTGVSVLDALLPLGLGQRIGLFAGAGAGKSTLMGMLASGSYADVIVVGLIGERGREIGEFINDHLSQEARVRTTVVVATSNESAARRYLAAETATAIAEYHRNAGKKVLLLMDSLTRVARALREISLAAGELPVRQGYTASVYSELPILLERSGNDDRGSITAVYTVLMNGDNDSDPLADEIKSLLDGHIVLHAAVAARGLRPAIDITQSVSRVAGKIVSHEELAKITKIHAAFARLKRDRDIVNFGGKADDELSRLLGVERAVLELLSENDCAGQAKIIDKRNAVLRLISPPNQRSTDSSPAAVQAPQRSQLPRAPYIAS